MFFFLLILQWIMENYEIPTISFEYVLLENIDDGFCYEFTYLYGFLNLCSSGDFRNDSPERLKEELTNDLLNQMKVFESPTEDIVHLSDYRFGLVDKAKNIDVYPDISIEVIDFLRDGSVNLIIAGEKVDFSTLTSHTLFKKWFSEYCMPKISALK